MEPACEGKCAGFGSRRLERTTTQEECGEKRTRRDDSVLPFVHDSEEGRNCSNCPQVLSAASATLAPRDRLLPWTRTRTPRYSQTPSTPSDLRYVFPRSTPSVGLSPFLLVSVNTLRHLLPSLAAATAAAAAAACWSRFAEMEEYGGADLLGEAMCAGARVVVVEDCVEAPAAFVLHLLLKRALAAGGGVALLALAQPFSHYDRVLRKMVSVPCLLPALP